MYKDTAWLRYNYISARTLVISCLPGAQLFEIATYIGIKHAHVPAHTTWFFQLEQSTVENPRWWSSQSRSSRKSAWLETPLSPQGPRSFWAKYVPWSPKVGPQLDSHWRDFGMLLPYLAGLKLVCCPGNLCLLKAPRGKSLLRVPEAYRSYVPIALRLEDPRQSPTSSLAEWAIRHSSTSMERWTTRFDWVCATEWVLHQLSAFVVTLRVFMLPFSLAPIQTLALTSKLEHPIISSGAFPFGKIPFTWRNSCRAICNQSKHKTVKRCTACVSSELLNSKQ